MPGVRKWFIPAATKNSESNQRKKMLNFTIDRIPRHPDNLDALDCR